MVEGLDKGKNRKRKVQVNNDGPLLYVRKKREVACGKKIPEWDGTRTSPSPSSSSPSFPIAMRACRKNIKARNERTDVSRPPPPPVCTHVKTQLASRTSVPFPSATFPHLQFSDRGGSVGITVMPIPSRKENVHVSPFAAILSFHIYGSKHPFSHGGTDTT